MSEPDVVAQLSEHISDAASSTDYVIEWRRTLLVQLLSRARDEIVALREAHNLALQISTDAIAAVRVEALEEAATAAGDACLGSSCRAVHAIRALKGQAR